MICKKVDKSRDDAIIHLREGKSKNNELYTC
jgi:hypothetical protein